MQQPHANHQVPYMNHRPPVTKESQSVQTDKTMKISENRVVNNYQSDITPVISKTTTKLGVPNPITSPVINPVIPKVPNINVTDINFLPRCQSANAAVNLGMERNDMETHYPSSSLQSSLGGSMNIVQSLQERIDPNLKPREKSKLRDVRVNSAHSKVEKVEKKSTKNDTPRSTPEPKMYGPEHPKMYGSEHNTSNTSARKPDTSSAAINVINAAPMTSKAETKPEAPKNKDFLKKEKANATKCDNKNTTVKHDRSCTSHQRVEQNDLNKMLPKFKYDNELVAKADYAMNQIPNYHTTHSQYQWTHWDPTRQLGTWDQHRFLDMKNTEKNYLDKFQSFNLPHLDQMQKSPQKLHQKDFHNITYGALSAAGGIYAATGLSHFKEAAKPPVSKSDYHQKNECKSNKQAKSTTSCQTQCEKKAEAQMKQHMMQRQTNKQQEAVACAEYRQQSPQTMTSPNCKNYQNGPCEKTDVDKKKKKEESPKEKEDVCQAPSPVMQSMGVYTPDSTSNSVHSVQYPACELDVSQLGLESPSSIGSDLSSPCSMLHMHPAPSPQYPHAAVHLPPINQPKQQKINHRNRNANNGSGGALGEAQKAGLRLAHTPPARHRATPPAQQHAQAAGAAGYGGGYLSFPQQQQYTQSWPPSCSLAKLQQMAEANQHTQVTGAGGSVGYAHGKYYATNQLEPAPTPPRNPRNTPSNLSPMQHMQMAPASRMSPNLNPQIIGPYINGYRVPPQQQFNNLPVQMMNVQPGVQYPGPDPRAQQPNVYYAGYINPPPPLAMQPLNSTMRR